MKVALFCGGRGSATIITEIVERHPDIELSLLINGYDDGLSTGEVRRAYPEMLGPSDFRKNLGYVTRFPWGQYLLEYRMKSAQDKPIYHNFMFEMWARVAIETLKSKDAVFDGMAFGNLLFAGAFQAYKDFNKAVAMVCREFQPKAGIINVTDGSNRTLMASYEDEADTYGIYESEVDIVHATKRISQLMMEPRGIPQCSDDAVKAIDEADVIVYGPGTQHSSLFPSYLSVRGAIARSESPKVFIMNLAQDNDIQFLTGDEIVESALYYLGGGDSDSNPESITHVLQGGSRYDVSDTFRYVDRTPLGAKDGRHNGSAVVRKIRDIYAAH